MATLRQATRKLKHIETAHELRLTTVSFSTALGRSFYMKHAAKPKAALDFLTCGFAVHIGFEKHPLLIAGITLNSVFGILETIVWGCQSLTTYKGYVFDHVGLTRAEIRDWEAKITDAEARGFCPDLELRDFPAVGTLQ
jgi:hypothetical protein